MIFINFLIIRICNIVKGFSLIYIVYIQDVNFKEFVRKFIFEEEIKLKFQYYNVDVYRSVFVLFQFVRKVKYKKKFIVLVLQIFVY